MPDPDPQDLPHRVARALQDQGTILARLQFELEAHLKEMARPLDDFRRFVMDPEDGLIVRTSKAESDIEVLQNHVSSMAATVAGVKFLQERITALEGVNTEEGEERRERRQWGLRDVLVPTILSVLVAVVTAILVRNL